VVAGTAVEGGRRQRPAAEGGRALTEEGDAEVAGILGLRRSAPGTPVEVTRVLRGTHERRRR
jgi:hypothetical protein